MDCASNATLSALSVPAGTARTIVTESPGDRALANAEHAYWRRNARALAAGNVLINIGWNAAFAFLPLIVQAMGVERNLELWVGVMMFGYYATSCLSTPVWGVLADHYGRKSMVLRAGFGMAAGFAVLAAMSNPIGFLCVLVFVGLGNGFVPAGQALVATSTPPQYVGGALALTQTGAAVGTLLGPLAGAALIGMLPTSHGLFVFTAVLMFLASILALTRVHEAHVRPAHALRIDLAADIRRLAHVPELKLLYYAQVLFSFTVFGAMTVVSLYTMELMRQQPQFAGLSVESWVAATAIAFTIAGIVALPIWGQVLNRYSTRRVLTILLVGTCVTSVLQPLVTNPFELTVARMLFGVFVAGLPPALIRMIKDRAPQGMEARTLSYGTALQQLGSATAPLIAGILAPYLGLRGFFWLCSVLLAIGAVLWLRRSE
jgi:DHA1 family multidrug resistance protein-like MFS transporter